MTNVIKSEKTQRGLTRHKNTKHKQSDIEMDSSRNEFIPENILNPLKFKIYYKIVFQSWL